ncbi:MAG: deoxynucleoside kinase [Bacteroidota bacterium]|nr:deoxynucleoside kinase [Bacteroidota bacterium]MDP4229832.1 deoxynucleoside kinase [Bacteroidota bacterium]MDP4236187.1 deoxynucleoside kinase [Bacteroidota bacterium]
MAITNDGAYAVSRSMKQEAQPIRYIAVEGPIGVGKSTLADMLAQHFRARLILERYEENPFLQSFYDDRRRTAFQTQLFFLLSRYRQQQELIHTDLFYESCVSDYLFNKDRIFAEVNLTRDELKLYEEVTSALDKTVPIPDVVIYLQGSVSLLQQNIKKRGRNFEKNMNREYLEQIVSAYNDFFFHYRDTRLIVASCDDFDFLRMPEHFQRLVTTILRSPYPPVEYLSRGEPFFELTGTAS